MHLAPGAPTLFLQDLFQHLTGLRTEGVGPDRVYGTAVLEHGFDSTPTVGIEPMLHYKTRVADAGSDLIKVVGGFKAELGQSKVIPDAARTVQSGAVGPIQEPVQLHPMAFVCEALTGLHNP